MRTLITGAAGFAGSHLTKHLTQAGDEVVCVDQTSGPDLRDAPAWVSLLGKTPVDVLYHLGGLSSPAESWHNPTDFYHVNSVGTANVLAAAEAANVPRVVLISSAAVYDQTTTTTLDESCSVAPSSPYAASKLAAETFAEFYSSHLEVVIARPFSHIGPGQGLSFVASSFAAQIAELEAKGGGQLRHGNLSPSRDFSDVRDVAAAYRLLGSVPLTNNAIYNVCSEQQTAIKDLLKILANMSEAEIELQPDSCRLRPADTHIAVGSAAKIRAATGWQTTFTLNETLASVLEDARRNLAARPTS